MAIVRMKKAFLIAHNSIRQEMIDVLHERRLLHVSNLRERLEETELGEILTEFKPQLKELNLLIDRAEFVLDFLKGFEERKKGLLQSMMKEKVKIDKSTFSTIEDKIDFDDVYQKSEKLDSRLTHIKNRLSFLITQKESLETWVPLKLKFSEITETKSTRLILGQITTERLQDLQPELAETMPESLIDIVNEDAKTSYVLVFIHKAGEEEAQRLLYQYGFHPVSFQGLTGTPGEEISKTEMELEELERDKKAVAEQVKELQFLKPDLMVLLDYLENKRGKIEVQVDFAETREAFMLEGWVETDRVEELKKSMGKISDAIELTVAEPAEEEKPPIVLRNKPLLQPFEVLTRLYGLPDYNEPDPTPLMAPFFFLFFGFCVGDFGYGLILFFGCWLAARSLKEKHGISENTQRFLMLFAYGGVASMLIGVITGGYFGIEMKSLPSILRKMVLLDPLGQADLFLLITWVLGIIQITFGIAIEIYDCLRHRNYSEAIFTNLTTLLFLLAAILWLTCWLAQAVTKNVPAVIKTLYPVGVYSLAVTALFLIFAQGGWLSYYAEQVVAAFKSLKDKKFSEAVQQSLQIIYGTIFAAAVIGWVATLVGFKGVSFSAFGIVALFGVIVGVTRPIVTKFLAGVYSLYGMSSFLGDILSYSRLMALGLATVLIGLVVNMLVTISIVTPLAVLAAVALVAVLAFLLRRFRGMSNGKAVMCGIALICAVAFATMLVGMGSGLSFLKLGGLTMFVVPLVLLVVVGGHAFNLIINLIGAFVHPLRLQYVEFFPKFYEDGGKKFEPFGLKTKYLFFKES